MSTIRRLVWDIETSPNRGYFWRAGRKLNIAPSNIERERAIICIAYKWEGINKTHSLEWDNGCDLELLKRFGEVAAEADELIAHNGDKYDIRFFKGRHLIHGLDPMPALKTRDTLKMARKHFDLNSFRLDYLGRLFGLGGKDHTDWQMWIDITEHNCPKAMTRMIKYCKRDVRLLEQVWQRLAPYEKPATHAGVFAHRDKWSCPHCASENVRQNKRSVTAAGTPRFEMQCKDCGRYYSISQTVINAYREHQYTKNNASQD